MEMSTVTGLVVAAFAVAFVTALAVTPLVKRLAFRVGAVARPKSDRWHKKPTAMMGGIAVFVAVAVTYFLFPEHPPKSGVVFLGSAFLFLAGLVDDFLQIRPYQKLVAQILGAALITYFGLVLPWTAWPPVNIALTIFWIVGITNAINLLDNMDGLAAGIAAIACSFLAINFVVEGQTAEAVQLAGFAGALVGFLVFNSNPASIFMGDCGSLFIGFFLASSALLTVEGHSGRSRSLLPVLAVPVLILLIPIFDTTFVTLLRKLSGRAASQGGRDHTSHRLVALGLSERNAVFVLYGLAIASGTLAVLVRNLQLAESLAAIGMFTLTLTFVGVHLARVKVYDEREVEAAQQRPVVALLIHLTHRRRIFEVVLDLGLVIFSYYAAYAILFGPMDGGGDWWLFMRTLPLVVMLKMGVFLAVGVYRGIWRYITIENVIVYAKAVVASSAVVVLALLFAFRFLGFSRAVFILDALILFCLLASSRFAFRVLRRMIHSTSSSGAARVLIYGAGDAGELLVRELRNNSELNYLPVAFIDDDRLKIGKTIHGLPVHASADLRELIERLNVDEVFVSTSKISDASRIVAMDTCENAGIGIKEMKIQLQPLVKASHPALERNDDVRNDSSLPYDIVADDADAARLTIRRHGSTEVLDLGPARLGNRFTEKLT